MAFDFKKEFKQFYKSVIEPEIVNVPEFNYIAVRGKGDPNEVNGEYKESVELLYPIAYAIKMSKKTDYRIKGYFDFVVPPLEGFWWQEGIKGVNYSDKSSFNFISLIRLPDFVQKEYFDWAIQTSTLKKKRDFSKVEFFTYTEGLCVQSLHVGPYYTEPRTVEKMHDYINEKGYILDISDIRFHHEIYLGDPRKTDPSKLKTIIRHPIKVKE